MSVTNQASSNVMRMTAMEIISLYRSDLSKSVIEEFPVTPMSAALATAVTNILHMRKIARAAIVSAVDVGTGCGIHSAVLSVCGCKNIFAIDISNEAILAAKDRFTRLSRQLNFCDENNIAIPKFEALDLTEIRETHELYDIIVSNPPGYYCDNISHATPLKTGLYDGPTRDASDPRKSFLYKYFEQVIAQCLAPGGVAICTWPALEFRLVHALGEENTPVVHPARLLEAWFGWKIYSAKELSWKEFFSQDAPISGSSFEGTFLQNFRANFQSGYYSYLVRVSSNDSQFTFPFGILALIRDRNDPNRFELMDLDANVFEDGF